MKRLLIAAVVSLLLAVVPDQPARAADGRYNVLFFAVDDLRPELNCYGAAHIRSPNLDKLASKGLLFERAYCQQAVCSPSRTSLLTGRRPDTTRVYDLVTHFRKTIPDVVTLPQYFMNHGYFSQGMGKIFHGSLNDAASWSVPWSMDGGPAEEGQSGKKAASSPAKAKGGRKGRAGKRAAGAQIASASAPEELEKLQKAVDAARRAKPRGPAWDSPDVADNQLGDGLVADHAVEALRQIKDKPFFLAVGFRKPHLPFIAPKRYYDLYDPATIRLADNPFHPKGAPEYALVNSGELRSYDGVPKQGPIPETMARQLRHAYYASTSYTDAQIGRVIDELDRLGLREKTIIIVWGDHGWKLGEHGEWCKHSNVENDTNAPLIISVPGQKTAGQKTKALVEFVDIYPSLCDLAGLPVPQGLEGTSFAPLIDDPNQAWKAAAFSQYPRDKLMGYSMRTDRYRFTRWVDKKDPSKIDAVELYDHQADPAENLNMAVDPANAALVKQLLRQSEEGWRGALKEVRSKK